MVSDRGADQAMDNPSSFDTYDIECSAMKIAMAYHPHIEVRVHSPNEPVREVTLTYWDSFTTEVKALADAQRRAEVIKARPADHL
jgi:hypothetical protein